MLKRPVNSRFNDRIRAGIKITTIREKPWPVGKPITLSNGFTMAFPSRSFGRHHISIS